MYTFMSCIVWHVCMYDAKVGLYTWKPMCIYVYIRSTGHMKEREGVRGKEAGKQEGRRGDKGSDERRRGREGGGGGGGGWRGTRAQWVKDDIIRSRLSPHISVLHMYIYLVYITHEFTYVYLLMILL